ncbi:DNA replication protein psf1 [Saitoella coloradoensis]
MYGDASNKLILDSKRTLSLDHLPPYQSSLITSIIREIRSLTADTHTLLTTAGPDFVPSQDPGTACQLLVQHLCRVRNKRCLMAYHNLRAQRIAQLCWEGIEVEETRRANWSPEEGEYGQRYNELLAGYKGQWTDVDLTGSLEPPRELFVDVRVLRDAGEIQTEYGVITLTKNSQFFVRQGDVERLIQQGYLQKLD